MKFSIAIIYIFVLCAVVELGVVEFSADIKINGLEGVILFIKRSEQEPATIKSNLQGKLLPANGFRWEIRKTPTLHFYGANDGYCNQAVANSELYIDFTASNDQLRSRGVYVNEKIVVDYSNDSILGHSVVLRDGETPIACATILPANQRHDEVVVHRARFNQMIGGEVYFIAVKSATVALGYVYGIDSNLFGVSLDWKLVYMQNSKVVGSAGNEASLPSRNCSSTNQSNCFVGELGSMSNYLIATKANNGWASMHHIRYVFPYLDIAKLPNQNLAIKLEPKIKNSTFEIAYPMFPVLQIEQTILEPLLYSNRDGSIVSPHDIGVTFSQPSPYHTTSLYAKIDINSEYMKDTTVYPSFTIYNAGSNSGSCKPDKTPSNYANGYPPVVLLEETSYENLPPFKNFTDSTMHLEYPVFVSLFGSRSVLESILEVDFHKQSAKNSSNSTNDGVACGPIKPPAHEGLIHLSATFSNETGVFGSFDVIQYLLKGGKTDAIIWLNINYESGNKSINHMVHIHEYVPDTKSQDPHWRCSVTAGHFNPLSVTKDEEYRKLCSESTAYRCEIGDLSGKFGNYNVGYGKMKVVDPTLELQGKNSPNGRSLVIHGANGEKEFIGCDSIMINPTQR